MNKKNKYGLLAALAVIVAVGCATSPTGRKTIRLMGADQMDAMGVEAYQQLKQEQAISKDARATAYVQCVSRAITSVVGGEWEVTLFEDDSANAFALPGGKIGVHTGLLKVAANQSQLAAVVGHEVGHVLAEHSNERASASTLANVGLTVVDAVAGAYGPATQQTAMSLLGLGTQVGLLLPFSRAHESEADIMGLEIMAKAGFDPRESVSLWQNMASQGGGAPPEFLSTHPSHSTRIADLQAGIPAVMPDYQAVQRSGRGPKCRS